MEVDLGHPGEIFHVSSRRSCVLRLVVGDNSHVHFGHWFAVNECHFVNIVPSVDRVEKVETQQVFNKM